jgi:2-polyprenyl-3-methyl-5-hydroxy-6-metoxy-1,4-benzoquinol methylase
VAYSLHSDPRSSHQRIARFVRMLGRDPILDVGASSGQLGQLLAGSGLTLDGIEPDADSAAVARPNYRSVSVSTIEAADLVGAPYRVIVAADVLEHTPDPTSVLKQLVAASTDDAVFVISLPNIGHLAARLLVLSGRFPHHDRGIFDRTHLHFYTRETALELMASAGLSVTTMNATPVPLEDVWPPALGAGLRELAMRGQTAAARVGPTLFAFQWLFVARRT